MTYITRRGELKRYDVEKKKFADEKVNDVFMMDGNARGAFICSYKSEEDSAEDYILDGDTGEVFPIPVRQKVITMCFLRKKGYFLQTQAVIMMKRMFTHIWKKKW